MASIAFIRALSAGGSVAGASASSKTGPHIQAVEFDYCCWTIQTMVDRRSFSSKLKSRRVIPPWVPDGCESAVPRWGSTFSDAVTYLAGTIFQWAALLCSGIDLPYIRSRAAVIDQSILIVQNRNIFSSPARGDELVWVWISWPWWRTSRSNATI